MVVFQLAVLTVFGLTVSSMLFRLWNQRSRAERDAERHRELAMLGTGVREVAHDLGNLLTIITSNLSIADELPPAERREVLDEAARAITSASGYVRALSSGAATSAGSGSTDGVLRLIAGLLKRKGARIVLEITGDLVYVGPVHDAVRVVQNLLINATREATHFPNACVRAELSMGRLRISNPVRDPSLLDASIYERGVSRSGSSGMGLAITRESAARVGWSVRHEIVENWVHFIVESMT